MRPDPAGESARRLARVKRREPKALQQRMKSVGPYSLYGKIGEGPNGNVYVGVHAEFRNKSAVKILSKRFEGDAGAFLEPLRAAIKLNHPNIASALSVQQAGDRVFIASEFVEGSPIGEFSLTPSQAVSLLIPVAEAVHAAHLAGVVHGDLKPNNILIDEKGTARVVDFCTPPSAEFPYFMSPAQAAGGRGDRAGDVRSLGAVLYALAVRKYPFDAETPAQAMQKIAAGAFAPPRKVDPSISPALDAVIVRALRGGYGTAGDLAVDLRAVQSGAIPAAMREARVRTAGVVAAAVVALAAGVLTVVFWPKGRPEAVAVRPPDPGPGPVEPGPEPDPPPDPRPVAPPPPEPDRPKPPPDPDPIPDPPKEPELPVELLARTRSEVGGVHASYLDTYLLPEERARLRELLSGARGTPADEEFLRARVLGVVAPAIRDDIASVDAQAAALEPEVKPIADRVAEARKTGAWKELAAWCAEQKLPRAREYALAMLLKADPMNAEARRELGYRRTPAGFWRQEIAARAAGEGIEFEGRTYSRDQLRALLLERGYVLVDQQWCRKAAWTFVPPPPALDNASMFAVYRSKTEQSFDPISKVEVQLKAFEKKWTYVGPDPVAGADRCEGTAAVLVEAPLPFAECRARVPSRVLDRQGSVSVWFEADGEKTQLYEITKDDHDITLELSGLARGKRRFALRAVMKCPYDGRDRRQAQFLPGDLKFEVTAALAEAVPELTRLLGAQQPGLSPEQARQRMAEAAERLVQEKDGIGEALSRVRMEAALMRYEGPIETPLEYEGIARLIGDPAAFELGSLPEESQGRLRQAWAGWDLAKKRAFAAWYGTWVARERSRPN